MKRVLVTGAGGFIGSHLVRRLKAEGHWVRGADVRPPSWSATAADEFLHCDLRSSQACSNVVRGMQWVFHLAADMGGIAYLTEAPAEMILRNTCIDVNMMRAVTAHGHVKRLLFTSSACVYPQRLQGEGALALREFTAYPASPQGAYGWEKLHMEHLCFYCHLAGQVDTRVARLHNVYGPEGEWRGETRRAKAPADLCRKVAMAKLTGDPEIEMWGDGNQVRSFMYVDDCVEGLLRLMESGHRAPLNLGRDRAVTINQLAGLIAEVAGIEIALRHVDGPMGVRARNSDNTRCRLVLGWTPGTALEEGLVPTYEWIEERVRVCL